MQKSICTNIGNIVLGNINIGIGRGLQKRDFLGPYGNTHYVSHTRIPCIDW